MKNLKNRKWTLAKRPIGMVGEHNFSFSEEEVRDIEDGEFLIKNLYLSFDPAQRGWMEDRKSYVPPVGIGEVMRAGSVGQVIESNNPNFSVGDKVQGTFGWQEYAISDGKGILNATIIPEGASLTAPLSVFGITGLTAYFGLLDVGQAKEGDTVLVSGAAGSTGSIAAQIAKLKGCRVIGVAGGTEKCRWLTEEAKIDAAIDYKAANMAEVIPELCPEGVDVIFDNVGGEFLNTALMSINQSARLAICGAISGYNNETPAPGPSNYNMLIIQRARMEGFIVLDYMDRFPQAIGELMQWVQEGKIVYQEDIQEGIENAPNTLLRLYTGLNQGKQLLKIADPD
jgi:NADPH-dependent curcumin reductase CurA